MIESSIMLVKNQGEDIDSDTLKEHINSVLNLMHINADEECVNKLYGELERSFQVKHTQGSVIYDNYGDNHKWYSNNDIKDPHFWHRYRRLLLKSIGERSVEKLDFETLPNILNCLRNPKEKFEGRRFTRGLVIGDVQSGKTATYAGLICKAADAGFKVVILLAGITENLRRQTQERIDEGVVGMTVQQVGKNKIQKIIGVGLGDKSIKATSFTTRLQDFKAQPISIMTTLDSQKSLAIFVIKKNVSVLKKLRNWLSAYNTDSATGYIDTPMLLIDDEADNASVNTRKDETDPTQTNKLIREICYLFKDANYVGFTATPFANVFIDPDSVDSMQHADLFPENFIYILPTPSNYIGATKIFYDKDGDNGKDGQGEYSGNLCYITDIEEPDYDSEEYKNTRDIGGGSLNIGTFYHKHHKEWRGILPRSLREAVICFFMANVVRDLRGQSSAPRSMLVNMSRFVNVQEYIRDEVSSICDGIISTITYDFSDGSGKNKKLALYKEFESLWNKYFSNVTDISFSRAIDKKNLLNAVSDIRVVTVNTSKSSASLDYKAEPSMRVIAVGGLALSRGLTLEGLLVSYFYRNTATFDVLMQMGRWFGYRPHYDDLFRIWMSRTSAEWYAEITKSAEELKRDLKSMYEQKLTPKDFGIRVRDNCDELRITASNKMRHSFKLEELSTYYGNIFDTPYISLNATHNKDNLNAVADFASALFKGGYRFAFADCTGPEADVNNDSGASRYFADVPKDMVVDFLGRIKCSLVNMFFNTENIIKFVIDVDSEGLESWDVVFEGGDSDAHYEIPGLEKIKCMTRSIYGDNTCAVQISSRRRMLGLREGKFALTAEQQEEAAKRCRQKWVDEGQSEAEAKNRDIPLKAYFSNLPERKPLLIIALIKPIPESSDEKKKDTESIRKFREELGEDKIAAFAVGFPGRQSSGKVWSFKANKTYREQYMNDENGESGNSSDYEE